MTGTRMVHVPYGGGGPAALGAMTNQVQALFSSVLPVLGMLRSGTLKAIAVASDRRSELLPDVPTFKESGLDYQTGTWFGMLVPARTPPEIIGKLHGATVAILQDQAVRAKIVEQGADVIANSPAEFRAFIRDESARLAGVIRNSISCGLSDGREASTRPLYLFGVIFSENRSTFGSRLSRAGAGAFLRITCAPALIRTVSPGRLEKAEAGPSFHASGPPSLMLRASVASLIR
jgi:hypothetical protein